MSTPQIVLEYRREAELSTGRIVVGGVEEAFEKSPFDRMLYRLAAKIVKTGACEVLLMRIDRPGYRPYPLDRTTVELLRLDPVAAVEALTYRGSPSSIFQRIEKERVAPVPPLRAGVDVLAVAFGEEVYVRLRGDELECPGCGFWSKLEGTLFQCKKRCLLAVTVEPRARWAAVSVPELLSSGLSQFYLPRAWNPESWATRADLEERYQAFTQEREDVRCSMQPIADRAGSESQTANDRRGRAGSIP